MKSRFLGIIGMIINNVHNNAYTVLVESHYQLFELVYALYRIFRIRGIRSLKAIVIQRIIAPVVLRLVGLAFVNRCIIEYRQQLNVSDPQLL